MWYCKYVLYVTRWEARVCGEAANQGGLDLPAISKGKPRPHKAPHAVAVLQDLHTLKRTTATTQRACAAYGHCTSYSALLYRRACSQQVCYQVRLLAARSL